MAGSDVLTAAESRLSADHRRLSEFLSGRKRKGFLIRGALALERW
jgi:hypothetical protein